MWLKDPKTKQPSVTLTMFVLGFVVATLKLLTSGLTIHGLHLGVFGGGDFAAAVGALGSIYALRRHTDAVAQKEQA